MAVPQDTGQSWVSRIFAESGEKCSNCEAWRRLVDDYFIEKCPNCGDDETYLFILEDEQIP